MMKTAMRRYRFPCICAAALALGACSTQELSSEPLTITGTMPAADQGALMIIFASTTATFEEEQVRAAASPSGPPYHVFMDGRQLSFYSNVDGAGNGVAPQPYAIGEGSESGLGFLPAGKHDFRIAAAGGGPTIFTGSGEIPPGSTTRLYIFGELAALQGRFVSYPSQPAAGKIHVSVMNLVRTGQRIEAVRCADEDTCVALSPPLALGESFDADLAGGPLSAGQSRDFALSTGERVGARQVPDERLTAPPVMMLLPGIDPYPQPGSSVSAGNLVGAFSYMSPDGNVHAFFL